MATAVFLPGGLAPAVVRYAPLRTALGDEITTRVRELELYNFSPPPPGYGVDVEVEALRRCLEREGSPVHIYGHSAGGAVALAFVAMHPDYAITLAVDEPAFDFTSEAHKELEPYWPLIETFQSDPGGSMARFLALELKPGVEFRPTPGAAPPLPNRPSGVATLLGAFRAATIDPENYRRFKGPVLFTRGTLSNPRYLRSAERLSQLFPRFREEVFEGLHHFNTSHQVEPDRVAALLRQLWSEAD